MTISLLTLPGIPMVEKGDDLLALIETGMQNGRIVLQEGDVFVLAQKIVSKSEGRLVYLSTVTPGPRAIELGLKTEKDPRLVELVLSEAVGVVWARKGLLLVEHRLGHVMANAGIDRSNVEKPGEPEAALLLPIDPDVSARKLRIRLMKKYGVQLAVVINDSVSRPWRNGTCGIAVGSSGLPTINDMRGTFDLHGRELKFSITGYADEISAAASLVMGQGKEGTPVVIVRGLQHEARYSKLSDMLLPPSVIAPEMLTPC
jgi:coenzyme F420-0:L-glutamate ligase/coenzyme F420-1:gamma-L-glutamate ligase